MNLSENDIKVLNCLKNHKKAYSQGIALTTNLRKFTVLRSLSTLIKLGHVKRQKGAMEDGYKNERIRIYKLKKETMWSQPELHQDLFRA